MTRRRPRMDPDTAAVVDVFVPQEMRSKDPAALEQVMPTARAAVAKTVPRSPKEAKAQLRYLAPMLLKAHRERGSVNLERLLVPNKVEAYSIGMLDKKGPTWCADARGVLANIGRANNPQAWPRKPQSLGAHKVSEPYSGDDEVLWRAIAAHMCKPGRPQEAWTAVASIGAGISGNVLSDLTPDDVVEMGEGRLAVRVTGPKRRLVPIRLHYTDLARTALEAADGEPFIPAGGRNAAHHAAKRLAPQGGEGLSYWRARSTWLTAHLRAGTPLPALWRIAGGLSIGRLADLIEPLANELDDETAARQGLGA